MLTLREVERAEVAANFQAFEAELPDLLRQHAGKYAAYRDRKLVGIFDNFSEADADCDGRFDDGRFSVQEITNEPLDLKWLRYASDEGAIQRTVRGSD
jgi:hypothetical protein